MEKRFSFLILWEAGFWKKFIAEALSKKLKEKALDIKCEFPIKVNFEGEIIGDYFCDILVEDKVIVELKAIEKLSKIHEVQLVNYLKATDLEVGLLINFVNRSK